MRLAEISGIAQTTISLLERKSLRGGWIDTIEILADALGLSIDEYVGHKVVTKHG